MYYPCKVQKLLVKCDPLKYSYNSTTTAKVSSSVPPLEIYQELIIIPNNISPYFYIYIGKKLIFNYYKIKVIII